MQIPTVLSTEENEAIIETAIEQFNRLISLVNAREIPLAIAEKITYEVDKLNATALTGKSFLSLLKKQQTKITSLLEKELKLVPIHYYRNMWLLLGMSAFGLPIGVSIGLSLGNIALLGIGLPIGMLIGFALGSQLDKNAAEKGNQLSIELK